MAEFTHTRHAVLCFVGLGGQVFSNDVKGYHQVSDDNTTGKAAQLQEKLQAGCRSFAYGAGLRNGRMSEPVHTSRSS